MSTKPNAETEIQALLADLWQRHLPAIRERMQLLDRAAQAVSTGSLSDSSREEALSIAHKMAGNLGMFGYTSAGSIASEVEQRLKDAAPEGLRALPALVASLQQELAQHLTSTGSN